MHVSNENSKRLTWNCNALFRIYNLWLIDKILNILPKILADSVGRMHVYPKDHMAVISILDQAILQNYLKEHQSIEMENEYNVLVFPAYLLVALPKYVEDESYSLNRFSDKGKNSIVLGHEIF